MIFLRFTFLDAICNAVSLNLLYRKRSDPDDRSSWADLMFPVSRETIRGVSPLSPFCRGNVKYAYWSFCQYTTASGNSTKPLFEPLTVSIRSDSLAVCIKPIDTSPGLTEQVLITFFMTWHFKWPRGHVWPQKRPKLSRPQKSTKVGSNWSAGPQKSFA